MLFVIEEQMTTSSRLNDYVVFLQETMSKLTRVRQSKATRTAMREHRQPKSRRKLSVSEIMAGAHGGPIVVLPSPSSSQMPRLSALNGVSNPLRVGSVGEGIKTSREGVEDESSTGNGHSAELLRCTLCVIEPNRIAVRCSMGRRRWDGRDSRSICGDSRSLLAVPAHRHRPAVARAAVPGEMAPGKPHTGEIAQRACCRAQSSNEQVCAADDDQSSSVSAVATGSRIMGW